MTGRSNGRTHQDKLSNQMQEITDRDSLLSSCEGDEFEELFPMNSKPSELEFTRQQKHFKKKRKRKCSACFIIPVLTGFTMLAITIYFGRGIKFLDIFGERTEETTPTCPVKKIQNVEGCSKTFPWQSYRLPETIKPQHYEIFLHPNLTHGNYTGKVDITVNVLKATNKIVLHTRDLLLTDIKIFRRIFLREIVETVDVHVIKHEICKEFNLLAIFLRTKLIPGQQYSIAIEFFGNVVTSLRGFYLSKYKTHSGESRTLATTQFESTDARSAFPCFDEPAFKAQFSISMVRDEAHTALSNMPMGKTEKYGDELMVDKFETTVTMSTYLVAFIVSDFASISKTINLQNGAVKVSVYAPEEKIATAKFALNVSCEALTFYEKVFKVPYPLPKLDLVAIPDFEAGAMENWGLVTYRETMILYNETSSSFFDQEAVVVTIAHELAHQWFGDLVTMQWWNDLWLNEGFASYVEYYGEEAIRPEWHAMSQFYAEHTREAMTTDESEFTHPISTPVRNSVNIEEVFDGISYSKGGCVIKMMIGYLGRDTFFEGVTDYLKRYAFQNARNKDLVEAVAARAHSTQQRVNVLNMLDTWTTEAGFPIINISLSKNEVTMSQMRYLLVMEDHDAPGCKGQQKNQLWDIPVSYMTDSSPDTKWMFFPNKTTTFAIGENNSEPEWIVFNVKRSGYYLINYSKNLLRKLSAQMKKDHTVFSSLDRSGIIFNAGMSSRAGYLSHDVVLEMLFYLKKEEDYVPITTGTDILSAIMSRFKLQFETEPIKKMKLFISKLMKHLYDKYGWPKDDSANSNLSHLEKKLRSLVVGLMCSIDYLNCTAESISSFKLWKEKGIQIHRDYKNIVYSTAVRLGTSENWDFLWKKYTTDLTIDASEKKKIMVALCHTTEEKKIVFLLDEAIKGEHIRSQDADGVFAHLRATRIGGMIAWRYIRSKWSEITTFYPPGSTPFRGLFTVFRSLTDESDIAAAEQFIALHHLSELRFVKRALADAKLNVHWIDTYQPQIIRWLDENAYRM